MADPKVLRTFRIPVEEWEAARHVAASRGERISDVIRDALRRYVTRHRPR